MITAAHAGVVGASIALVPGGVEHYVLPVFSSRHSEQSDEGVKEVREVHEVLHPDYLVVVQVDRLAAPWHYENTSYLLFESDGAHQVAGQYAEDVVNQENELRDVHQAGQTEPDGVDQSLEAVDAFDQLENSGDSEDPEYFDYGAHRRLVGARGYQVDACVNDADDDDDEIELVPAVVQVVIQTLRPNFETGLQSEDRSPDVVQVQEDLLQ